jgi:single-strand DNA-binding protein
MASLNKVFLIGNLTRPPELRYTPSGTAVADLRLAVNRNYTTQSGEKREDTCFLSVVVWGKQAETCGEYLDKGSPILVDGRLQTREWESKDGQKRSVVEVVAERVQFMGRGKAAAPAAVPAGESFSDDAPPADDDVPF